MGRERQLHEISEASEMLRLNTNDVQWLVKTGQLPVIRVRGRELIDSKDIWELVDTYKAISRRKEHHVREF